MKRQTENLHVDYFVTRDFNSEYKSSALLKIEKSVEEDYVSNVQKQLLEGKTDKYVPLFHLFHLYLHHLSVLFLFYYGFIYIH